MQAVIAPARVGEHAVEVEEHDGVGGGRHADSVGAGRARTPPRPAAPAKLPRHGATAMSTRHRLRRHRPGRRPGGRALRGRAGRRRREGRHRRARADRRRVLVLGVHPVQDAAAAGRGARGGARGARREPGRRRPRLDVDAVLRWRDFQVSDYDDDGQVAWAESAGIAVLRGEGRLAGPGAVAVGDRTYTARDVVIATGSDPNTPRSRASTRSTASGTAATRPGCARCRGA